MKVFISSLLAVFLVFGLHLSTEDDIAIAELEMSEINAQISKMQAAFKAEEEAINQEIYLVGIKENAIEMEVKRLETQVSTLEKQLEKVEEAEGSAIDRATPQFKAK